MVGFLKTVYYFLLDLTTLRKGMKVFINNFPFRLPTRYYKYYESNYEQDNFTFFKRMCRPHMNIIDIGAHFGLFTVYMQKALWRQSL